MRNNSARLFHNFPGRAVSATTYSDAVYRVLREQYWPRRNAAKLLARDARTTPRAAANWLLGRCAPNGENLVELMARCDALADEINRLVELRRRQ